MPDRLVELIDSERIITRVGEMAKEISDDYRGSNLLVAGVLKGCFIFLADLTRRMDIPVQIDFLRVASYGDATETSGVVEIKKDLEVSVTDRDVLIVEDIVDTGLTLAYIGRYLQAANPNSLRFCSLLDKHQERRIEIQVDYVGFRIGKEFVVGYGLDRGDEYRSLPSICSIEKEEDPQRIRNRR